VVEASLNGNQMTDRGWSTQNGFQSRCFVSVMSQTPASRALLHCYKHCFVFVDASSFYAKKGRRLSPRLLDTKQLTLHPMFLSMSLPKS